MRFRPRPVRVRGVIFDLDGTLIHSAVDFTKLKRRTIEFLMKRGLSAEIFSMDMKTYEIMWCASTLFKEKGVTEENIALTNREVSEMWNQIELESVGKTTPIDGANETLLELKKRGFKIGVVTRSCREYAVEALRITGLLEYVDVLVGRDDTARPKPSPDPLIKAIRTLNLRTDETVMIGDNIDDAQCACGAKVRFIGIMRESSALRAFEGAKFEALHNDLENLIDMLG